MSQEQSPRSAKGRIPLNEFLQGQARRVLEEGAPRSHSLIYAHLGDSVRVFASRFNVTPDEVKVEDPATLRDENTHLRRANTGLQRENRRLAIANSALTEQNTDLTAQNRRLGAANARLAEANQTLVRGSLRSENSIRVFQGRPAKSIGSRQATIARYEAALAKQRERLSNEEQKNLAFVITNRDLQRELTAERRAVVDLRHQLTEKDQTIADLRARAATTSTDLESALQRAEAAKDVNVLLQAQRGSDLAARQDAERRAAELAAEVSLLRGQNIDLQRQQGRGIMDVSSLIDTQGTLPRAFIAQICKIANITQSELAQRIRVSPQMLSLMKNRKESIDPILKVRLLEAGRHTDREKKGDKKGDKVELLEQAFHIALEQLSARNYLTFLRQVNGLTQSELGRELSLAQRQISKLESGQRVFPPELMQRAIAILTDQHPDLRREFPQDAPDLRMPLVKALPNPIREIFQGLAPDTTKQEVLARVLGISLDKFMSIISGGSIRPRQRQEFVDTLRRHSLVSPDELALLETIATTGP